MAVISSPTQEKVKLDLYDKKIIFCLSQNSRMSLTKLAKSLKISVQRCKYKVCRLKRDILEPAAFLTYPLIDIPSYIIFTPQLSQETLGNLLKEDSIYFLTQSIGKYQYIISVVTDDIMGFCCKNLSSYHIKVLPIINSYADDYNPFNLKIPPKLSMPNTKLDLDKKDLQILAYLGMKPTDSLLDIQKATGIDRQTIKQRVKNYEDSNIIQKFRYGINIFKIGYLLYTLNIMVAQNNKKVILESIRSNIYSGFVFESYGNYIMQFMPPSHNDVFEFTKKLSEVDPTVQIDVMQNTEFYKIDMVPNKVIKILKTRINHT